MIVMLQAPCHLLRVGYQTTTTQWQSFRMMTLCPCWRYIRRTPRVILICYPKTRTTSSHSRYQILSVIYLLLMVSVTRILLTFLLQPMTNSSFGHPDGEHIVAPILDAFPLVVIPLEDWPFGNLFDDDVDLIVDGPPADAQGDGENDEDVVTITPPVTPIVDLSSDSSLHSLFATKFDDDTAMSVAPSPARDPTPLHDPEPGPELDLDPFGQPDVAPIDPKLILDPNHVPFGLPDIAPLIPDPVPAPVDLPVVETYIPPHPSADVAPLPPIESDVHRTNFPIVFLQDILAFHPGEGTLDHPPSYDHFASAALPPIPQTTPFTPFTSTPLDEPFQWFHRTLCRYQNPFIPHIMEATHRMSCSYHFSYSLRF
ncbi:hypothetical protein Hanom_Chr10g00902951 [Helianthus anomalus]